jgi:hypothetical protein
MVEGRGANDRPRSVTDEYGQLYETFDASNGWKMALGRELKAAGFEIDWDPRHGIRDIHDR